MVKLLFLVVSLDESECICPFGHTPLSGHGTYRRKLIMKCGCRIQLDILVGICPACRHVHVEHPNFIRPYKHYESSIIQDVVDGKSIDTCVADDSTIRRW